MTDRERFIEIFKTKIKREGSDKLLAFLMSEQSDFFTAPASTRFHGNYEGGLLEHSLNVYDCLCDIMSRPRIKEQYGIEYSQAEMREMLYPDGSDKTYIEEASRDAAFDYMIATLVAKELGVSYTDEQYAADLSRLAEEYTAYYEVEYAPEDIEKIYGKEVMRLSFIEAMVTDILYERMTGKPSVPERTTAE